MTKVTKRNQNPKITVPVGMKELLPELDIIWQRILFGWQQALFVYGMSEVHVPMLEEKSVFEKFYTGAYQQRVPAIVGTDKAPALRAAVLPQLFKAYANRTPEQHLVITKWAALEQVTFWQGEKLVSQYEAVVALLGPFSYLTEAQTMNALWSLFQYLEIPDVQIEINMVGNSAALLSYENALKEYLREYKFDLCDVCNEALKTKPLHVLRCSMPGCVEVVAGGPTLLDYLDADTQNYYTKILESLDELQIPYELNAQMIHSHSPVNKTQVRFRVPQGKKHIVIAEGAHYTDVFKQVTGKTGEIFAITVHLEALHKVLLNLQPEAGHAKPITEVFLVPLGELAARKSLRLFDELVRSGIRVYDHFGNVGVKSQLKSAVDFRSPLALIIGQKEAMDEEVILRDVKSGMQEVYPYDKIIIEVKKRLGR